MVASGPLGDAIVFMFMFMSRSVPLRHKLRGSTHEGLGRKTWGIDPCVATDNALPHQMGNAFPHLGGSAAVRPRRKIFNFYAS